MDYFDFVTVNWAKVPADIDAPDPIFDHAADSADGPEYPLYGSLKVRLAKQSALAGRSVKREPVVVEGREVAK